MSLSTFAVSLGLTLLLEVPFAWVWGLRSRHNLTVAVLANGLTNPAVVLLHGLGAPVLPLEAAAVAVEALYYRACGESVRCPLLLALCANGWSYSIGAALNLIF